MSVRKGAPQFSSLLDKCVLWYTGEHSAVTNAGKTITANGNVTQSTTVLDPWGLARPVGYFDGSGDYLTIPDSDDWDIVSVPFTIAFSFYLNSTANQFIMGQAPPTGEEFETDGSWAFTITGGKLCLLTRYGANVGLTYLLNPVTTGTWYRVVMYAPSTGATAYLNINGTSIYEGVDLGTEYTSSLPLVIGRDSDTSSWTSGYFNGYLSEIIIKKGIGDSSLINSPTRFKPDAYTKLLLHMHGSGSTFVDDPFIDYDEYPIIPSGVTVTNNGTWTKTNLGNNKSVLNFDGATNYIDLSDNAAWYFGTDDLTIAFWIKCSVLSEQQMIFCNAMSDGLTAHIVAIHPTLGFRWQNYHTSAYQWNLNTATSPTTNTWYCVTCVRYGTSLVIYINGESAATASSSASVSDITTAVRIGARNYNTLTYVTNGNLKDLMIWKGRALTQPEIKLLMNRTHPLTGAGLMPANGDYWRI